jgi:hypothetical protein
LSRIFSHHHQQQQQQHRFFLRMLLLLLLLLSAVDKGAKSSPLISKLCFYNRSRAQTAEEVAARVMEAAMRGEYLATTNAVSFMLGVLGRGSVPAETMSRAMAELLLMLPLRIVSMVWFSYAKRVLEHSRSSASSRTF